MTTERFLEILREEIEKEVHEHGLILKGNLYDTMAARLILEEEKSKMVLC